MHPKCIYCLKKIEKLSIKCEQCDNIVLCIYCFSYGAEAGKHKRSHKYFIQQYSGGNERELFNSAWSPEAELALLDYIAACGLGNWNDVSSKLISYSPAECRTHYESIYLSGPLSALLPCTFPKIRNHNSSDPDMFYSEDAPSKHAPSPEECKILGYMPKRNDFECEYNNDAENSLCKIRVESTCDPLFLDLIVAKVEMFVERLRERRQCHLLAGKLDMLTHFLPRLRQVTAAFATPSFCNNQSRRLTWSGASPIRTALRLKANFISQSDTNHAHVLVSSSTGRKRGRRKRTCTDACTHLPNELTSGLDIITKVNCPLSLTNAESQSPLPLPSSSYTDIVVLSESSLKTDTFTSIPVNTNTKTVDFDTDCAFPKDSAPSSVEFQDSGVGSSECSLHSTTSSSNTEIVGGMAVLNSNTGCKTSPIPEESSVDTSRSISCLLKSPPSTLKRRYSHPFISPRYLRSESVSRMAGSLSSRRMSASPFISSLSKFKMTRTHDFRIKRGYKRDTVDYVPPPNCCSPCSISEQLKPLLRFLTSSEAQLLLTDLHKEHVLRQEIDQLHQLQMSGFTNLENLRLTGAEANAPDSDTSSDVDMVLPRKYKITPRSATNKEMRNNSAASPSAMFPRRAGRPRLHNNVCRAGRKKSIPNPELSFGVDAMFPRKHKNTLHSFSDRAMKIKSFSSMSTPPSRRPRGRPRLHNFGSRGSRIPINHARGNSIKATFSLSIPPANMLCPVENPP